MRGLLFPNAERTIITDAAVECIWRSTGFRMAIKQKLAETLMTYKNDDKSPDWLVNPQAIEAQIFAKSRTKDEYLELSARVIIHFKHLHCELQAQQMQDRLSPAADLNNLQTKTAGIKRKQTFIDDLQSTPKKSQKLTKQF